MILVFSILLLIQKTEIDKGELLTIKSPRAWDFSFSFRLESSKFKLEPISTKNVQTKSEGFSPEISFEAVRKKAYITFTHNFRTDFKTTNENTDQAIAKEETRLMFGRYCFIRSISKKSDFLLKAHFEYRQILILENDPTTPVDNDFRQKRNGPSLFMSFTLRGAFAKSTDWDLGFFLGYSYQKNSVSEKEAPESSKINDFSYDSNVIISGVSAKIFLPFRRKNIQFYFNYGVENHNPIKKTINATQESYRPTGFILEEIEIKPKKFHKEGILMGLIISI